MSKITIIIEEDSPTTSIDLEVISHDEARDLWWDGKLTFEERCNQMDEDHKERCKMMDDEYNRKVASMLKNHRQRVLKIYGGRL